MEYNIPPCFYRVSVKALIHNNENRFLLVKEENWLWELPGGWIDYGEDLYDSLTREIHEEMWLIVTSIQEQPSYFYTTTNLKKMNIANVLYETTLESYNFIASEECTEIWFFTLEEAKKLETYPNIQTFLKYYNPKNHGNI